TAAAKRVLSRSCERSLLAPLEGPAAKKAQALRRRGIPTHGTAARHKAEAQAAQTSIPRLSFKCAMTRISKAYGTLSPGGFAFAAAINFLCNSVVFIQPTYFQTVVPAARLQILLFAHFG